MTERYVPSFILLVPGPWQRTDALLAALARIGIDASVSGSSPLPAGGVSVDLVDDPGLGAAVARACHRLDPSLAARLDDMTRAALVEVGRRLDGDLHGLARLGRALMEAGGVVVRMERSGLAMDWETWLARVESQHPRDLLSLGMTLCRDADGTLFTCGMHHFDLPDAEIVMEDVDEAAQWLETFCAFQLEGPKLISGHTFRPHEGSPRRVLERWPDHRHAPADGRHNPFGVWRALAPGQAGIEPLSPVHVCVPSLSALLLASERQAGRPLSRQEVESVLARAAVIAMEPAQAIAMERSRGYADIEPRLAWEQWQIVRSAMG